MQKVKISVVLPDYNWVICKVDWVFFHTSGYKKLLDELLATKYWGDGFSDLALQGCLNIPTTFFGVYPEEGKRFCCHFLFHGFTIRKAGGFKDFLKFHPQKLGGTMRCDAMISFFKRGAKNHRPANAYPKMELGDFFSQDALSWCEGNIQPTRS